MYGGSVGAAVFGIGGIEPIAPLSGGRKSVAPIPWLPDAPRGAAVWRSLAGATSVSWAATMLGDGAAASSTPGVGWHVWVNVTVPAASNSVNVKVMLPVLAEPGGVCAWECGLSDVLSTAAAFTSQWVSFDAGGGHHQLRASAPAPGASDAPTPSVLDSACSLIWRAGAAPATLPTGIESTGWEPARRGYTLFPALGLAATSGAYAVFAKSC